MITKDKYPRVLTVREHEFASKHVNTQTFKQVFGPFPGLKVKEMMRLLQKLFYISTCKPADKQNKPCFYYQLGQCLGVCTGEISATEYKKRVITPLVRFLRGNKKSLIKDLEKKMNLEAKEENFEEAARLRNQINNLNRIQDVALLNKSFTDFKFQISNFKIRIEGYDISNLGSVHKVGSMVVFENGHSKKSDYRKFNIKRVIGQSDVDCLAEVLERRLRHPEWPYPDVILVDGGKPQVNKARAILKQNLLSIPVIGIAKGADRKKNEFVNMKHGTYNMKQDEFKKLLIKVRDEAHRFAITFSRSKRKIVKK